MRQMFSRARERAGCVHYTDPSASLQRNASAAGRGAVSERRRVFPEDGPSKSSFGLSRWSILWRHTPHC